MAEARPPKGDVAAAAPPEKKPGRAFPLKGALIVLVAFALQVAVVFLVISLAKPASAGAGQGTGGGQAQAPTVVFDVVDLGTFGVTQFQKGDPVNRRQLSVSLAVAVVKQEGDAGKRQVLEQKVWVGQLLDEVIGPLSMDDLHASNREQLKQRLKTYVNKRIGEEVAKEVILRIQAFGP